MDNGTAVSLLGSEWGNETEPSYIETFEYWYEQFHPPLVCVICIVGAVCNVTMIMVLWRMMNSMNILLLSLSFSQLLLLINYLYSTLYTFLADVKCWMMLWSWNWTFIQLMTVNLTLVCHTIAVFHFVCISLIRFLTVTVFHRRQSSWLVNKTAIGICIAIYAAVLGLCTPFYFNSELTPVDPRKETLHCFRHLNSSDKEPEFVWVIRYSEAANTTILLQFNYWMFAILCKLVPCATILVFTLGIAYQLRKFEAQAARLRQRCDTASSRASRTTQLGRTNRMILIVLVLFLAVELPQGILNLLRFIVDNPTYLKFYHAVLDPFDLLTVFYSSVNFTIFCSMSSQFRKVFWEMMQSRKWRWLPVPAEPTQYPLQCANTVQEL